MILGRLYWYKDPGQKVGRNLHETVSLRLTTLEEDRELFVDFSSIWCLWLEIQGTRTNFFDRVSNSDQDTSKQLTFILGTSKMRTSSVMVPTTTAILFSRPGFFILRTWRCTENYQHKWFGLIYYRNMTNFNHYVPFYIKIIWCRHFIKYAPTTSEC